MQQRIFERIKEIIEFKDPELLQQLFVQAFPNFYWRGLWDLVKRSIEVAIELQDHKTIKEIEKRFFLKYEFENAPSEFETIKHLIHEFNRNSNRQWGKLNSRFQAAIAPSDTSCF